ncbi:MAG: 50S ribosomal protein L33 [Candidatus Izemoplasmatales bacterium]|jgi:large subunit ribosomal protein L33|nr:50S ribosomal protein L33 [bacterium]MDZ4196674.1 50S ribosomal protein L33 [Candidatus Izemoplasmatales bacterium]
MNDKAILICQDCLSRNYEVKKSGKETGRMEIKKYCKKCQKHTIHKESK